MIRITDSMPVTESEVEPGSFSVEASSIGLSIWQQEIMFKDQVLRLRDLKRDNEGDILYGEYSNDGSLTLTVFND